MGGDPPDIVHQVLASSPVSVALFRPVSFPPETERAPGSVQPQLPARPSVEQLQVSPGPVASAEARLGQGLRLAGGESHGGLSGASTGQGEQLLPLVRTWHCNDRVRPRTGARISP